MKKQFLAKGQTRFSVPVSRWVERCNAGKRARYFERYDLNTSLVVSHRAFRLAVGQTVKVRDEYEYTDEGYSHTIEYRSNERGVLHRNIVNISRDCDGLISSNKEQKLVDGKWVSVTESQRDYEAEKAGY